MSARMANKNQANPIALRTVPKRLAALFDDWSDISSFNHHGRVIATRSRHAANRKRIAA